jgi:peptidoglycan/xylan/chitin deacetylase (PgdA/CDA1 family)
MSTWWPVSLLGIFIQTAVWAQTRPTDNATFIRSLYRDTAYTNLKARVVQQFAHTGAGRWGEFVREVDEDLLTNRKVIALTFDACGGRYGSGYDRQLIDYLRREKIPATLFVSGKWIDANPDTFVRLAGETLFEIENHGFNHQPCSVDGQSEYGICGTADLPDAFDEIEANALKIQCITGRRPEFYRSATAYMDEACAKLARQLGYVAISFDVLSGDAVPNTPAADIARNVLTRIRPGALVIMHFNRPEWNTAEALQVIVPQLQKQGYRFAKLEDYPLKAINR